MSQAHVRATEVLAGQQLFPQPVKSYQSATERPSLIILDLIFRHYYSPTFLAGYCPVCLAAHHPHQFLRMSNIEQIATYLPGILPLTSHHLFKTRGSDIVTCRVARSFPDLFRMDLAFCCECGSADLEVCYTSKALGPHLCPTCGQSKGECGTWMETQTQSSMREQRVA